MLFVLPAQADAYTIVVDGAFPDWDRTTAPHPNGGLVQRSANGGDISWKDASGDANSVHNSAEDAADLVEFRATASPSGLHFFFETELTPFQTTEFTQFMIAIDHAPGGQTALPGLNLSTRGDRGFEFLVQTQFHTGATANVSNTVQTLGPIATAGAPTIGTYLTEMTVPWTLLGFTNASRPESFRFTVILARTDAAGTPIAVHGAGLPAATDVVTDFADPSQLPTPTTFSETSDGVVDFALEADFPIAENGDVRSPLLITAFNSNPGASGTEFVAITNVSSRDVDLGEYAIGDEETVDGGEGMLRLPTTVLSSDSTFEIAQDGAAFQTMFGRLPDAEVSDTSAATNLSAFSNWASGSVNLANGGDQWLLIDGANTIVDVANYGSGSFVGMTVLPNLMINQIASRQSPQDTNDMTADFSVTSYCVSNGDCANCETCENNLCAPVICPDTQTVCSVDVCNVATNNCETIPGLDGETCDDGLTCTENDMCGAGVCSGTTVDCTSLDDVCNDGVCNEGLGACERTAKPDGALCSDGDFCTTNDMCVAGVCETTPKDCTGFADSCNDGVCNPVNGMCESIPFTDGTSCEDGDLCTIPDTCVGGICQTGATDCTDLDDQCNVGMCDGTTGSCVAVPMAGACDDANPCTENDACNNGVCSGSPVVLQAECGDDCNFGICDSQTGQCVKTPRPDGSICDDENNCTENDSCVAGVCQSETKANGSRCNDGDRCTDDDVCENGVCAGSQTDCSELESECQIGRCTTSGCEAIALEDGTVCDDNDPCTDSSVCLEGSCVGNGECGDDVSGEPDVGVADPDMGNPMTDTGSTDKVVPADDGCSTTSVSPTIWMLFLVIALMRRRRDD